MNRKELKALNEKILACDKCPMLSEARMYPMPGYAGKGEIKLFVIGINPGPYKIDELVSLKEFNYDYEKHYEAGLKNCLVGKFASKAFDVLGITWDEVFFTNLIKCATPDLRPPKLQEINNCFPYLVEQVNIVCPPNILLFGKAPAEYLGVKLPFLSTKVIYGTRFIVCYHPTYIRRNNSEQAVLKFFSNIKLEERNGLESV